LSHSVFAAFELCGRCQLYTTILVCYDRAISRRALLLPSALYHSSGGRDRVRLCGGSPVGTGFLGGRIRHEVGSRGSPQRRSGTSSAARPELFMGSIPRSIDGSHDAGILRLAKQTATPSRQRALKLPRPRGASWVASLWHGGLRTHRSGPGTAPAGAKTRPASGGQAVAYENDYRGRRRAPTKKRMRRSQKLGMQQFWHRPPVARAWTITEPIQSRWPVGGQDSMRAPAIRADRTVGGGRSASTDCNADKTQVAVFPSGRRQHATGREPYAEKRDKIARDWGAI